MIKNLTGACTLFLIQSLHFFFLLSLNIIIIWVYIYSAFLSQSQEQPKIIEPLDYEAVVFQRKAQIHSDPHRDLLLCPVDDVSVSFLVLDLFPTVPSWPVATRFLPIYFTTVILWIYLTLTQAVEVQNMLGFFFIWVWLICWLKCNFVRDAFLRGHSSDIFSFASELASVFTSVMLVLCLPHCQNVGHLTPLVHESEDRCKKKKTSCEHLEGKIGHIVPLTLWHNCCVSLCLCSGGPDCPAEEDGCSLGATECRVGSQESVCQRGSIVRHWTMHVACSGRSYEGKIDIFTTLLRMTDPWTSPLSEM